MLRRSLTFGLVSLVAVIGADRGVTAIARSTTTDVIATSGSVQSAEAAQPPFNLEAVLHGDGFGLVKFRQRKDPVFNIIDLDVWVRDLAPNTSYSLQRATDTVLDGDCSGTNWLTLGLGPTPEPIVTDDTGTGRAALWRDLSALPAGTAFDIHFRIVENATSDIVLQSDCYRFVVRN
jgi:hypothetical protein